LVGGRELRSTSRLPCQWAGTIFLDQKKPKIVVVGKDCRENKVEDGIPEKQKTKQAEKKCQG